MTPTELRTLLKDAGRPVEPGFDPVPLIRGRARRRRRRRTVAAAVTAGALAVSAAVAVGTFQQHLGEREPTVAAPVDPPRTRIALDEDLNTLPTVVDGRRLVQDPQPKFVTSESGATQYLVATQPGDLLRLRYVCPTRTPQDPMALSVFWESAPASTLVVYTPLRLPSQALCLDKVTVVESTLGAQLPTALVVKPDPSEHGQFNLDIAVYR
ncbi:hypothetical protein FB561_0435 [Kribbella amoyensis]|uniref:Uncharacterized protein n=1 Tax=Kribbella amoyensis TaxID=996641 RepID=A0A561BKG9_9ACTN|nr:hypothetical protein [Kribbella amoyensis]TWD79377.1 hypothetical protein FB561_0435 [Kribbella amoyensis]